MVRLSRTLVLVLRTMQHTNTGVPLLAEYAYNVMTGLFFD